MGRRQRRTNQANVHSSVTEVDSNCDKPETQRVGLLSTRSKISRSIVLLRTVATGCCDISASVFMERTPDGQPALDRSNDPLRSSAAVEAGSRENTGHVIPGRRSATGSDRVELLAKSRAFFSLLFAQPVHAEQHLNQVFWKSNTSASNHLMTCTIYSRYDGKLSGKIGTRNTAPDTLQKRAPHGSQIFRSHTGSRSRGSIRDYTGARPERSVQCVRTQ